MVDKDAHPNRTSPPQKKTQTGHMNAVDQPKRKIFCIGFNKTGTSSLHRFFQTLGLTSVHNSFWPAHGKAKVIDESLFDCQCYSDGEKSDFVALDNAFPGSLFILNNRDERDWLYSRLKHVMRYNENVDRSSILTDDKYGWMARDFFFNEALAIRKWICERRIYISQALLYFNGRGDFLEIDITNSRQWTSDLLDFLKRNSFPVNKESLDNKMNFHENMRDSERIHDQNSLERYKTLIDNILYEINHS